jgi:2-polyprenyl-6-methoxyphenol hydroxylase-like FAD-dependent oxidoreductase
MPVTNDVIIAGGGVAGTAAAAALAQLDYRVLIVEPGQDHARRLAGELIHPPGVADLSALRLLGCLQDAGGIAVHGFAVFASGTQVLPYAEVPGLKNDGLAIEHGTLAGALLATVEKLSNVTVWKGARVTGVDLSPADFASVTVAHEGRESQLRTSLLIAADGRNSHVRRMGGIAHTQIHLSNMVGFVLRRSRLPHSGFGHVFAGGPAPVLVYGISTEDTRVMFDVPLEPHAAAVPEHMKSYLNALPDSLRSDVEQAMETQTPLRSANYSVMPEAVVKGRLVCVGDAGGCCHPVTATGLSACARDAIRLRQALHDTTGDIRRALRRYASLRRGPQRTRMAGADVLYEVLKAATPEMHLLRQGLLRYWQHSPRGRAATMALLSTCDDRLSAIVREYMQVCRYALPELVHLNTRSRAMVGLSRALFRFLEGTIRGQTYKSPN